MPFTNHPANFESETVNVAVNGTKSGSVQIAGCSILGLITPTALDSTSITFEVSADGVTFHELYDDGGSQVTLTVATDAAYALDPKWFAPWRYIRLVTGLTETAARSFTLVGRAL